MATVEKKSTEDGDRWEVRGRMGGRSVTRRLRSSDAAKALKNRIEGDVIDGVSFDPRRGTRKLNVYFDEWLASRIWKGHPLALSTQASHRGRWRRNIEDTLGRSQLRRIDPAAVRGWYGNVVKAKGRDEAAKSYRVLHAVLATAATDGLIRYNPANLLGAGQEHHDERPMVKTSMALELADVIGTRRDKKGAPVVDGDGVPIIDRRYWALVVLTAFAATRTGEFLGLLRRHIDLLHLEVSIEQQAQEIPGMGRVVIPNAKTEAGRRIISIPKLVAEALEFHLANFVGESPDAEVFVGPMGRPLLRNRLSEMWRAACAQVGAPEGLRIYDLRHHALTLAARKPGITTKELMARGGHASARAALIYQHAAQERDREVADYLDDVIAAAKPEPRAPIRRLGE